VGVGVLEGVRGCRNITACLQEKKRFFSSTLILLRLSGRIAHCTTHRKRTVHKLVTQALQQDRVPEGQECRSNSDDVK